MSTYVENGILDHILWNASVMVKESSTRILLNRSGGVEYLTYNVGRTLDLGGRGLSSSGACLLGRHVCFCCLVFKELSKVFDRRSRSSLNGL